MSTRRYLLERVDEAAIVQLYADGFTFLPADQKVLLWHLYQAALAGRDIYYDQRHRHGLELRDFLETLVLHEAALPADVAARGVALHQALLDQLGQLSQPHGSQVRDGAHARRPGGGGSGRGRGRRQRSACAPASRWRIWRVAWRHCCSTPRSIRW